jgi:hypothetical protein
MCTYPSCVAEEAAGCTGTAVATNGCDTVACHLKPRVDVPLPNPSLGWVYRHLPVQGNKLDRLPSLSLPQLSALPALRVLYLQVCRLCVVP